MNKYFQAKVAAWEKKTKTDKTYYSLKIEVKPEILEEMLKTKNYVLNANIFWSKSEGKQPNFKTIENDKKENFPPAPEF